MTAVLSAGQDHHFNNLHMYPSNPSSPSRTSDITDWKAKYYAVEDMLQETRNELDEFQHSSKELEDELERELERTEKAQDDLKNKVLKVEQERDDWMAKYMALQQTYNTTTNSLQRELEAFRQRESIFKDQLRELELGNDDLERNERQASSSLADVEAKYTRALEEKILLEHELQDKASLEETCQRLRDELRDVNLEVTVLKEQFHKAPPSPSPRPRPMHASTSSFELPTLRGDTDSLLHSPPPDLLFTDLGAAPPRAGTASETSSIHSRLSREFTGSNSTAPSSVASSTFGLRIRRTPTPASILNRALSPTASAQGGSRLPRRNVTTPLPTSPQTPRVIPSRMISTAALPRSKQMVSEMRARVRTLEQKIHSNMPRLRVGGSQLGNPRVPQTAASRVANKENAKIPDSPGWILVTEDGDQMPASPLHRPLAPSLPPLDFTKPSLGSLARTGSAMARLGRASPQRSVTLNPRPRSPTTSELGYRGFHASPSKSYPADREGPRAPSRIAILSVATSALAPPSPDVYGRPSTPTQSPQASSSSSPRKVPISPSKPPTTASHLGNRRRGSAGGTTSNPNVANAGATPGRPQRRNVTTPATPPPPMPSFRPIAKTMAATDSASTSAVHSALARTRMAPPRVASVGEMNKSRIGKPKPIGGGPRTAQSDVEDIKSRARHN